jgi:hypothetical protein
MSLAHDPHIQMSFILTTRAKLMPRVRTVAYKVSTSDSPSHQGAGHSLPRNATSMKQSSLTTQPLNQLPIADFGASCTPSSRKASGRTPATPHSKATSTKSITSSREPQLGSAPTRRTAPLFRNETPTTKKTMRVS